MDDAEFDDVDDEQLDEVEAAEVWYLSHMFTYIS